MGPTAFAGFWVPSQVALKVISLRKMGGWKALDLFEREVKVLKALQHPGVPAYLDSFDVSLEGDVLYYLVQRLATGQTLAQLVADGWRPTEAQVGRHRGCPCACFAPGRERRSALCQLRA